MQCPFLVLGLEPTATMQEIDKKYKQLMLKAHPDKASIDVINAEQQAKLLNEAREKAKELRMTTNLRKAQQFWYEVNRSNTENYMFAVEIFMRFSIAAPVPQKMI